VYVRLPVSQKRPDGTHQAAAVFWSDSGFGQNDVGLEFPGDIVRHHLERPFGLGFVKGYRRIRAEIGSGSV
jgi:hypothetical protein